MKCDDINAGKSIEEYHKKSVMKNRVKRINRGSIFSEDKTNSISEERSILNEKIN